MIRNPDDCASLDRCENAMTNIFGFGMAGSLVIPVKTGIPRHLPLMSFPRRRESREASLKFADSEFCFFFDDAQLPGVARRLLTFLASPRKVSKRRRPRSRWPFGLPSAAVPKMGSERNSLRSDNVHFFIHFRHRITGSVRAGALQVRLAFGIAEAKFPMIAFISWSVGLINR